MLMFSIHYVQAEYDKIIVLLFDDPVFRGVSGIPLHSIPDPPLKTGSSSIMYSVQGLTRPNILETLCSLCPLGLIMVTPQQGITIL